MTTIIGIALLMLAVAFLPTSPGVSGLLVLTLVAFDQLIGFDGEPGKDWTAAIIVTIAVGSFIWFSAEGLLRLLGV